MTDAWSQFPDSGQQPQGGDQWHAFPDAQPGGNKSQKTSQVLGFEQGVGNFLANAAAMPIKAGRALGFNMDDFQQGADLMRNPQHEPNTVPGTAGRVGADILESTPEMLTAGPFWEASHREP